ncbi:MAG TPA: hypothetical protein VEI02_01295, partial [Planctomycetota bacterium]|nr:hypothetical protein [Planctomycetota bacterium]
AQPLIGDELNVYASGADYGFPNYFGAPPPGFTGVPPVVLYPSRTAPTGLAFNPNVAISGYKDELYVALFTTGVARIARTPVFYGPVSGAAAGTFEEFAGGFVNPIDVEFLADGSMVVADFSSLLLHRIFPKRDLTLTISTPPCIGTNVPIVARSTSRPGDFVFFAASDAPVPATVAGPGLVIHLDLSSWVFTYSITPGNGVFNFPFPGVLNAVGEASASIFIPNMPILIGLQLYLGSAVVDAQTQQVVETAPQQSFLIIPLF